ncbi:protein disabled isoform X2 [Culicoides brevitarsis]|uniref:protein disabled isoform X2 n=1 Tax=Culicoides brevitarsis TaxID=469753 RepID=UPI00307C53D3
MHPRHSVAQEKDRNEPSRFFGDGAVFKAKLIGILEVGEARGDRMCQEALQDLKMAIRAAGEHKQKITIHVTIDGLRLRDEKTGDSLYHHPVHKISFIAQDMTDSRAFGYIFGSPDSGHRFFGIKTDKAASQVVLAMRDLFQVVFELKKKEIELARQHIQNKITQHEHQVAIAALTNKTNDTSTTSSYGRNASSEAAGGATSAKSDKSPVSVADLVDLEQELSSIQRGITQMDSQERIMDRLTQNSESTPKSATDKDDPFGDSFTSVPTYNLLPPPESSKRHQKPKTEHNESLAELAEVLSKVQAPLATTDDWLNTPPQSANDMHESVSFGEDLAKMSEMQQQEATQTTSGPASAGSDVFTDLDPLGTGKTKPFVDKKYFFQELKNPPKKLLRELSNSGNDTIQFDATFAGNRDQKLTLTDIQRLENDLLGAQPQPAVFDPFKDVNSIDMFVDDPFATDPFETESPSIELENRRKSTSPSSNIAETTKERQASPSTFINGPLQVNLPPENWSESRKTSESPQTTSNNSSSIARNRPTVRQNMNDAISSLSSKKMMKPPTLFSHSKFGKRDSNMRRLQESDSMSENELPQMSSSKKSDSRDYKLIGSDRPEPPPRPETGSGSKFIEPPPLPPKKQFSDIVIRPNSSNSNSSRSVETTRYDYLSGKKLPQQQQDEAPPLPLPSRRLGKSDTSFPGPERPQKKLDDDYLTPITSIPQLLPPPQKKDPSKMVRGGRRTDYESTDLFQETPPEKPSEPPITEMTLTHLLSLGIKDMAVKLNVPESKLSTMTIIELTSYLSKFLETSKQQQQQQDQTPAKPFVSPSPPAAAFKVNFDQPIPRHQPQDDQFFAKFDDNFGEDDHFEPDFEKLNDLKPVTPPPSADRYAAFREIIIEPEVTPPQMQSMSPQMDNSQEEFYSIKSTTTSATEKASEKPQDGRLSTSLDFEKAVEAQINRLSPNLQIGSIEPTPPPPVVAKIDTKITEQIANAKDRYAALRDIILVEDLFEKPAINNPPTSSSNSEEKEEDLFESFDESKIANLEQQNPQEEENEQMASPEINISSAIGITDAPIEPQDSQEILSELNSNNLTTTSNNRDDIEIDEYMNRAISNLSINSRGNLSPAVSGKSPTMAQQANASTSPMRLQGTTSKSPVSLMSNNLSVHVNDMSTSPIPIQKSPEVVMEAVKEQQEGSLSDVSPQEATLAKEEPPTEVLEPKEVAAVKSNDNWASFDQSPSTEGTKKVEKELPKKSKRRSNRDSPYSSDDKNIEDEQYDRKYYRKPASSRDLSPWEEDAEYRRRADRYGPRARPRMDSCDEDYDDEYEGRMPRRSKGGSRDGSGVHPWSPPSDRERYERPMYGPWSPEDRNFERNAYERSTYGPPHQPKSLNSYDRRAVYEKQKYYRDRGRMDFPFDDPYEDVYEAGYPRGKRNDYENVYDDQSRSREYFYAKDKRSFESNESYDSRGRYGSGEIYGYSDYRDRYLERGRLLKGRNAQSKPDLEQDSDVEMSSRRGGGFESGSLQRPRPKPMQIDDEIWGGQKPGWRPNSANEPDRRRIAMGASLAGSDGEKDRRFRRKMRPKEYSDYASTNYATMRYPIRRRGDDYYDYPPEDPADDPYYARQRPQYYKSTTPRSENRSMDRSLDKHRYDYEDEMEPEDSGSSRRSFKKSNSRDLFYDEAPKDSFDDEKSLKKPQNRNKFEFNDFEDPPVANKSAAATTTPSSGGAVPASKFNFDDGGFESDFNNSPVPPPTSSGSAGNQNKFRFSNDYSDKDSPKTSQQKASSLRAANNYETTEYTSHSPHSNASHSSSTMKLRFNENVKVSQFSSNSNMFEDDFSKANVDAGGDQWSSEMPLKKGNDKQGSGRQHDNIKKSESVNIFAKKKDFDPFEDDPFFGQTSNENNNKDENISQSFANFDANM